MTRKIDYLRALVAELEMRYPPLASHVEADLVVYGVAYIRMGADGKVERVDPRDADPVYRELVHKEALQNIQEAKELANDVAKRMAEDPLYRRLALGSVKEKK